MLIEKPGQIDRRQRADQRHRHGDGRDQRRAPVAQEEIDDADDDDARRGPSASTTSWMAPLDEDGVIAGDARSCVPSGSVF